MTARVLTKAENILPLIASIILYDQLNGSWLWFAVFWLTPDLSMLAYRSGPKVGAWGYNLVHTYLGPASLFLAGYVGTWRYAMMASCIWISHIAIDRLCGFGLKLPTGFKDTLPQRLTP